MVIFHSYVSLPEGTRIGTRLVVWNMAFDDLTGSPRRSAVVVCLFRRAQHSECSTFSMLVDGLEGYTIPKKMDINI